jgi:uncharacterized membrane-anchored protein YjiN (DUF445 family)
MSAFSRTSRQTEEVQRMKRVALFMLVASACVFVSCRLSQRNGDITWVGFVEAIAEAAMVGALADWFAVTALFRRPLGLPIPHTAIIPTRKNEIGTSLGAFVQENFLQPEALAERVRGAQPGDQVLRWLDQRANQQRVTQQVLVLAAGLSEVLNADEMSAHLEHALVDSLRTLDAGRTAAMLIETALADKRDERLLDGVLAAVIRALDSNRTALRVGFAQRSPWWVPGSVDERVFEKLFTGILDLLDEVRRTPGHELRASITSQVDVFVQRLQNDETLRSNVERLRDEALDHPSVRGFVSSAWDDIRQGLQSAAYSAQMGESSVWANRVSAVVARGTATLRADEALRRRIDGWAVSAVQYVATEHGHQVSSLIETTVQNWDANETSARIEEQIGRDLQFIRINGTVVGGLVGLLIHTVGFVLG